MNKPLKITLFFFIAAFLLAPVSSYAEVNKDLCATMIRFGKESFARGKYESAKKYFRQAVQADSTSKIAWKYYDQIVVFALAAKVKTDSSLTRISVAGNSVPSSSHSTQQTATPPEEKKPAPTTKKPKPDLGEVTEEEEEGC